MVCFAGPCSEGAADAAAALAALKAAVQAMGAAARPSPAADAKAAGRGRRGAGGRKGLHPSGGVAVVVLDEMDQLLAGDTTVLTELFLLPKVRPLGCGFVGRTAVDFCGALVCGGGGRFPLVSLLAGGTAVQTELSPSAR